MSASSIRQAFSDAGEIIVAVTEAPLSGSGNRPPFYRVKLSVAPPIGSNGQPLTLVPGMPVEAFIVKGEGTVLAYLLKPIKDQMQRIFRE
ncbi:hypothetical protein [Mesorhizobium sp. WSM2239]|uniref:Uncharacterized protein n=2 Tax=unclassified Mesorhizobium TaxID=325217 RepID=A0AAU8DIN8_9HYPH